MTFAVTTAQFQIELAEVLSALRRISRTQRSKVIVDVSENPAPGGILLRCLRDVVKWAIRARRVQARSSVVP